MLYEVITGQFELTADVTYAPDHVVGIFTQAVVGGAVALGAGTFVIDPQTATDVDHLDVRPQATQLGIEA